MTPERWKHVKQILETAVDLDGAARSAFLEEQCGGDADLRSEVEALLTADNTRAKMLESDAASNVFATESAGGRIGDRVGPYEITGELGTGGMGAVFLARRADGAYDQTVALKLIKRGMDSDAILKRFVNERQILASLEHPNIARLIDGGTTDDGLPYFVMEYVEGESINSYAERNELSLGDRLDLFRNVCSAVSFAHQNLIVHRDLKPSNILITKDGKAKLLDFGIAKLLRNEDDLQTATQNFVFTPEYASPEQVRGEQLTTATDIYSLGVILYELLAGSRPYSTQGPNISEIIKAVCETEPKRPSSVVAVAAGAPGNGTDPNSQRTTRNGSNPRSKIQDLRLLRGDLDNIILKALRKEPQRRYSSVEQFSDDIIRHQQGLPVTARADTWGYRSSKFVLRHRLAVAMAGLVTIAILAGIVGTAWQAGRAERERQRAEARFDSLRQLTSSLVSEIERSIRDLPGSLPARNLLRQRVFEQLETLAADSDGNPKLQLEIAWSYQSLSMLPDKTVEDSDLYLGRASDLAERAIQAGPDNNEARVRLAMIYLDMIVNSRARGDVSFTVDYSQRAVDMIDRVVTSTSSNPETDDSFWTANYHQMLTMQQVGRSDETVRIARQLVPVAERLYRDQDTGYNYMGPHLSRLGLGYGLSYSGDLDGAIREFEKALEECRAEMIKRPDADILRRNEANIRHQLATALESRGDIDAALEEITAALQIRAKLAQSNPADLFFQTAVADSELALGQMTVRLKNDSRSAIPRFIKALDTYQRAYAKDPARLQNQVLIARTKAELGNAKVLIGNQTEGISLLNEAIAFYASAHAAESLDAHLKRYYAESLGLLAARLATSGKIEERAKAIKTYLASRDIWLDLQARSVIRHVDRDRAASAERAISDLTKNSEVVGKQF